MSRALEAEDVHNRGSLMTHFVGGVATCVGYIIFFQGKAFDPNGLLKGVTQEQADTHNRCLSQAEIEGLDERCEVGQGNIFYWDPKTKHVTTFNGDLVSADTSATSTTVTFRRKGKVLRGRIRSDDCSIFFKRVS